MIDVDTLREPQRHRPHAEVPAPCRAAGPPGRSPLRATVAGAGRIMDLDEFLAVTVSTALVVVVDGVLVHERYFHGTRAGDRLLGFSATKSALALLVGQAVDDGRLPGLDTPVTDLVPELGSSGYAGVSLRQLLTMTSGVGWREDYHDPDSPASRMLRRWRSGAGGLRESLLEMPAGDPPGSRYAYCTPDSLALDWARERATGEPFPAALARCGRSSRRSEPAVVGLDQPAGRRRRDGRRLAGRHRARLGPHRRAADRRQVAGPPGGQPLLGPGEQPARAGVPRPRQAAQHDHHPRRLRVPLVAAGPAGEHVMADGMRGQFVYVDRPRRVVVVKTSAWPYEDPWWDRQCRDLCYLALPAIADAAAEG